MFHSPVDGGDMARILNRDDPTSTRLKKEEADYPEVLDRATERVKIAVQALIRDELRERRGLFR